MIHLKRRRPRVLERLAVILALLLLDSWVGMPTALAAGKRVPSGCDQTLDVGSSDTCQTARYSQYGYTASGLAVWVQATLDGHGYTLVKDGYFGPSTDTKVRQWQTAKGLTSDGIVGTNTWLTLDPFGPDPKWVFSTGICDSTGLKYYRTNGASAYQWAALSCLEPDGVGSGIHYLPLNDLCIQLDNYISGNADLWFVPANWRDPPYFDDYDDCRNYIDYEP